ncbi:MAG TPA: homoserine O-succinyltransferase [Rhizomicrobium sp.]|nr:homoserine O-succinyltransferase [Rhizomicrobium sp.]
MPAILQRARPGQRSDGLKLGIVNNMPDAALLSTARQFLNAIEAATPDNRVHVSLYSLPGMPRDDGGRKHLADNAYQDFADLTAAGLDAVIVTGTEPRAADLKDEPYWPALASLFDWIKQSETPALFSCLAGHAAVLHYDGIARERLEKKCFGLFEHHTTSHDELTQALPATFKVAHSRWNRVPAEALGEKGYRILTESQDAGVELFAKDKCVFFQGHPEYDTQTLGREYLRDVRRYLAGERETYPDVPRNYFNATEKELLDRFRQRAMRERGEALMAHFPVLANRFPMQAKRSIAASVMGAWLGGIAKAKRSEALGYGT